MADFFRCNVRKAEKTATLLDELKSVDNYVYILNVRFAGEIGYEKEIAPGVDEVQLPSMILQPIVENAVNHGIRDVEWAGHIQLIVRHISEGLVISVKDNGQGMTQERIREVLEGRVHENEEQKDSTGIGMDNVINRLELFFGIKGLLQIYSEGIGKGTEIRIMIPEKALVMQQQAKEAQEWEKMQGQDGVLP